MKCLACDGTGTYLYENDPPGKCPDCDGTGEVPENFYDGNAAMPDEIQPAFTPDEWKDLLFRGVTLRPFLDDIIGASADDLFAAIATANWSLPDDDPRKITRERLRGLTEVVRRQWAGPAQERQAEEMLALLAALLPPGP